MINSEGLVDFFLESIKLKHTYRYSSCPEHVQESSAGHSWQVALMVPIIAREFDLKIDIPHAMELALYHDLAECVEKYDFDSYLIAIGKLKQSDKDKSEYAVMSHFKEVYPQFGERIFRLWQEYGECKTPEARYVKVLDKIESDFHIIERGGTGSTIDDAVHQALYADDSVKNFPELKPLLRAVKKRLKEQLEKQGLVWKSEYNYPD